MGKIIQFPPPGTAVRARRAIEQVAADAADHIPVWHELSVLIAAGPGLQCTSILTASSLDPLRLANVRQMRLNDIIEGIDDGTSPYPDAGLAAFGFRRLYGEDDTMGRKIFALDLTYGSKAGPLYRKAKWPDWRSAVAKDCAELDIAPGSEPYFDWAFAIFTL